MKLSNNIYSLLLNGLIIMVFASCQPAKKSKSVSYIHNEGQAQGTYYSATYLQSEGKDLQMDIEKFFADFDMSLSTYNSESVISRINRNDSTVRTDSCFEAMFSEAVHVSEKTHGAFDITVGPLVNAWGFGSTKSDWHKTPNVKKLLPLIGYNKVRIENHRLIKENPDIQIDANALAQGLSADMIARLFEKNGCENYMIDIGGEIVCKGVNPQGKLWQIGVDKPVDDAENQNAELQTILSVSNAGLTTSGNYRKFYYKGGKKYAHTIDPKTGYPVQHSLLSATVVAPTCMQADAYATAFMVLGKDSAMALCRSIAGMDCYLIFADKDGSYQVAYTEGFKKYLTNEALTGEKKAP